MSMKARHPNPHPARPPSDEDLAFTRDCNRPTKLQLV